MEWNSVIDMTDDEEMPPQDGFNNLSFRAKRKLKKREKENLKTKRRKIHEKIKKEILEEKQENDKYFMEDIII